MTDIESFQDWNLQDRDGCPAVDVALRFLWCREEPHFVRVTVGGVGWIMGRDLLWRGLTARSGDMDVKLQPLECAALDEPHVELTISNGGATATMCAPSAPLRDFLQATYEAVPAGTEMDEVDWDQVMDFMLAVLSDD